MTPIKHAAVPPTGWRQPHLNALKHGMRSQTLVLPGEDAAEFQRMRAELHALHRPRTGNEARCVEAMANHEWVMERCRRVRDEYYARIQAVLNGESQHCEADPHRWHHKAIDCTLEEGRLQRHQERERRKLAELQKLRVQRLMADAEALGEDEWAVAESLVETPVENAEPALANDSNDVENMESPKRETSQPVRREAALPTTGAWVAATDTATEVRRNARLDFPSPAA